VNIASNTTKKVQHMTEYHSSELSEIHGLLHLGISFVEKSHHQQVSVSVEHDEVTVAFSAFQGKSRCLDDRNQ
jgi:hypothetical protein